MRKKSSINRRKFLAGVGLTALGISALKYAKWAPVGHKVLTGYSRNPGKLFGGVPRAGVLKSAAAGKYPAALRGPKALPV